MQQPAKNSLLVLGICLAIFSLWFAWFSYHEMPIQSPSPMTEIMQTLGSASPMTYSGTVRGLEGSMLGIPIWMVAIAISIAHFSQLMDASDFFYVPLFIKWLTLIAAAFFPVYAIIATLFHPEATPSYGVYVALLSSAIATLTLLSPTPQKNEKERSQRC